MILKLIGIVFGSIILALVGLHLLAVIITVIIFTLPSRLREYILNRLHYGLGTEYNQVYKQRNTRPDQHKHIQITKLVKYVTRNYCHLIWGEVRHRIIPKNQINSLNHNTYQENNNSTGNVPPDFTNIPTVDSDAELLKSNENLSHADNLTREKTGVNHKQREPGD